MDDIRRECDDFTITSRIHRESGQNESSYVFEENWHHMLSFLEILEGHDLHKWLYWNMFILKEQAKSFLPEEELTQFEVKEQYDRYDLSFEDEDGFPIFSLESDESEPSILTEVLFPRRRDVFLADQPLKKKIIVNDKLFFKSALLEKKEKKTETIVNNEENLENQDS